MAGLTRTEAIKEAKAHTKLWTGVAVVSYDNQHPSRYYWHYCGNPDPKQFTQVETVKNGSLVLSNANDYIEYGEADYWK